MSYYEIEKVRNLKHSQMRSPSKRQKIADNVDIVTHEDQVPIHFFAVLPYLHALKIYLNTLAVAGHRTVESQTSREANGTPEKVCFFPYEMSEHYWSFALEKVMALRSRFPNLSEQAVLQWLKEADCATRTFVMEKVRSSPKYTIGEAFKIALIETNHEWKIPLVQSAGFDMTKQRAPTENASATPAKSPKGQEKGNKGNNQKPGPMTKHGKEVCPRWNTAAGCPSPCAESKAHCCNVTRKDGKNCGQTSHNALNHPKGV
jgi:hypothetical protein